MGDTPTDPSSGIPAGQSPNGDATAAIRALVEPRPMPTAFKGSIERFMHPEQGRKHMVRLEIYTPHGIDVTYWSPESAAALGQWLRKMAGVAGRQDAQMSSGIEVADASVLGHLPPPPGSQN